MFSPLTKQKLKRICSEGEEEGVKEGIDILELLPYLQGLLLCLRWRARLCVCARERFPGLRKIFDTAHHRQHKAEQVFISLHNDH